MPPDKLKFSKLSNCTYNSKNGGCDELGCGAQAAMDNTVDLGNNGEADKRRDEIEEDAKQVNCGATPLVRPKFKE